MSDDTRSIDRLQELCGLSYVNIRDDVSCILSNIPPTANIYEDVVYRLYHDDDRAPYVEFLCNAAIKMIEEQPINSVEYDKILSSLVPHEYLLAATSQELSNDIDSDGIPMLIKQIAVKFVDVAYMLHVKKVNWRQQILQATGPDNTMLGGRDYNRELSYINTLQHNVYLQLSERTFTKMCSHTTNCIVGTEDSNFTLPWPLQETLLLGSQAAGIKHYENPFSAMTAHLHYRTSEYDYPAWKYREISRLVLEQRLRNMMFGEWFLNRQTITDTGLLVGMQNIVVRPYVMPRTGLQQECGLCHNLADWGDMVSCIDTGLTNVNDMEHQLPLANTLTQPNNYYSLMTRMIWVCPDCRDKAWDMNDPAHVGRRTQPDGQIVNLYLKQCPDCESYYIATDLDLQSVLNWDEWPDTSISDTDEGRVILPRFTDLERRILNLQCPACFSHTFVMCEECESLHRNTEITEARYEGTTRSICPSCADDNYSPCNRCNEMVHIPDLSDWNGDCYCESCYDLIVAEHNRREYDDYDEDDEYNDEYEYSTICEHHNANVSINPVRYETEDDHTEYREIHALPYFGIELEVDTRKRHNDFDKCELDDIAYRAIQVGKRNPYSYGDDLWHAEEDSSLSCGFEMISQPMSMQYWMHEYWPTFRDMVDKLRDMGMYSHDPGSCGLHVHITRKAFGNSKPEQEASVGRLIIIFDRFWDELVALSRRTQQQLFEYAKRYELNSNDISTDVENETDELHNACNVYDKMHDSLSRYYAINISNYNTIEIRIMRGTLKESTLKATMMIIFCLYGACTSLSINQIMETRLLRDILKEGYEVIRNRWGMCGLNDMWQVTMDYCRSKGVWPVEVDKMAIGEEDEDEE